VDLPAELSLEVRMFMLALALDNWRTSQSAA
jgi:hypothetical protein